MEDELKICNLQPLRRDRESHKNCAASRASESFGIHIW